MEIKHEDLVERYGKYGKMFKRGNVGLLCLLEHIPSKTQIIVANTHLYWNSKFDFVKFGQAFWLLKCISSFIEEHSLDLENTPFIICGDFNS